MTTTTEQTQRDKEITQLLLSNNIIEDTSGKISKCGNWINLERVPRIPVRTPCNNHSCRNCRRQRIEKLQLKHYLLNREFREIGGHILLFTLTIHHTDKHTLPFLHERFTKSLSQMKGGRGWKKLKEMTYYNFHYDNIEITNTNNSGHHYHNHLTFGYMNDDVSQESIKDELFNTWNHYTRKNGLRTSKKGIDVSYTLYGGHNKESGERSVKSIEESEGIKGTLEYWESVSWEYENEPNYTHPDKTPEEVGFEIRDLNKIFSKSKRGRIETEKKNPNIPDKEIVKEVPIIDEKEEGFLKGIHKLNYEIRSYSIGDLQGEIMSFDLYKDYENPHFSKKQILRFSSEIQKSDRNHTHLKLHKNLIGDPVWVDRSPKQNTRRR